MRQSKAYRLLRGAAAASVATFAALLTHLAAGGLPPAWLGVVVPLVLSLLVCTVLAGRKLSLTRLSAAVVGSQALFHTLFVLGAVTPTGADPEPGGHHGHLHGHDHAHGHAQMHGHGHLHGQTQYEPQALPDTMALVQADAEMWFWHGFAAVLTIAALYRGERAVLRLRSLSRQIAAWARRVLRRPMPVPLGPPDRCPVLVATEGTRGLGDDPLSTSVRRRGPPRVRAL